MANALCACKFQNIYHRDVKPSNILINQRGEVKLGDFGITRMTNPTNCSSTAGTLAYLPPEILQPNTDASLETFNIKRREIWALGITLIEVVYGELPQKRELENRNASQDYASYMNVLRNFQPAKMIDICLRSYSEICIGFVRSCLRSFHERPDIEELSQTAFCQTYMYSDRKNRNFIGQLVKKYMVGYLLS